MSVKPKVFITRRVPEVGESLLKSQCEVTQWDKDEAIPKDELLCGVKGVDALFCLLSDKIDVEVLDAAGELVYTWLSGKKLVEKKANLKVDTWDNFNWHSESKSRLYLFPTQRRRATEAV